MMNPMQAMPQQAPMGGQPPMGPMGGPQMGGRPPMGGPQGGFSMPAKGVNLFKIQEQLKDMPQQAVMAYANGQNPDLVPPYIALGEMERRTRAAKNAQPSQSPQGTVKDNLEQQIKQAAGLASLAGQKQQQMQQQQMAQSLQAPGPVPEDVPSPEAQAEPPVMMAGGGLATLPMNPRMTNYRDGGIIGYQSRGSVDVDEAEAYNETDDEDDDTSEEVAGPATRSMTLAQAGNPATAMGDPRAMYGASTDTLNRLLQQRAPTAKSRAEIMADLAKSDPEKFAMLNRDVEGENLKRLEALQSRQGEGDTQSREDLQSKRRMDLFQSLIAAGEATRGQKGLGGLFGGMGASLGRSSAERMEEEAALRALPLKRQEIMAKAQYEMQGLQRARAEGDVKAEAMHQQNLAKLNNELQKAQLAAAGRQVGASGNVLGRQITGESTEKAAKTAAEQRLESSKIAAKQREATGLARIAAEKEIAGIRAATPKAAGVAKAPPLPADIKAMQRSLDNTEKALAKLGRFATDEERAKLTAERDDLRRRLKVFGVTGGRDTDTMAPAPAAGASPKPLKYNPVTKQIE